MQHSDNHHHMFCGVHIVRRSLSGAAGCFESETSSPSLFAYNLASLEQLHDKRTLYGRREFIDHLRLPFLRTLFTTLLRRSHSLLEDEILVTPHPPRTHRTAPPPY